jgi:hypothetical protein
VHIDVVRAREVLAPQGLFSRPVIGGLFSPGGEVASRPDESERTNRKCVLTARFDY